MPCEINPCRLCQQVTPQPSIHTKNGAGQVMRSVRPGCHPEAELGPFVPATTISGNQQPQRIDVKV